MIKYASRRDSWVLEMWLTWLSLALALALVKVCLSVSLFMEDHTYCIHWCDVGKGAEID